MAMDFTSLTASKSVAGSIRNWVNSDKVPADEVLSDAENWLEQTMRTAPMVRRYEFTLAVDASEVDLSSAASDFLDPMMFWNSYDSSEVTNIPEFEIDRVRSFNSSGVLERSAPIYYAPIGRTRLLLDARSDRAYPMVLTYYGRPVPLAADNLTNLYTTNYRVLLRQVCMSMAYLFLKDEGRADALLRLSSALIEQINEADDLAQRGRQYDTRMR